MRILALVFVLLPAMAAAGEKAFITGTTRLINTPFAVIEPYIGSPNQKVTRQSAAHQWLDWGDGERNQFFESGEYTKLYYYPVKLVGASAPADKHSGPAYAQSLR